MPDVTKLIL